MSTSPARKRLSQENARKVGDPAALPDSPATGTAPAAPGTEATIIHSQSIAATTNSTPSALACTGTQEKFARLVRRQKLLPEASSVTRLHIWDIVPISAPSLTDLSLLTFEDLLSFAKRAWNAGRVVHDTLVNAFRAIMDHYDGRKSTRPLMKVEEAFASIGVSYEAARKLVYRDRKRRELEAIAASLHQPSPQSISSIFRQDDPVTIADGKGVIAHVHQTTGNIDVVLEDGGATITNVSPKHVTTLNGAAVIDGKPVKHREHVLVAGELLIDAATGKKWTYADGKFSVSNVPTREELKQAAVDMLMAERAATLKRKEEEKKARNDESARKELNKINAGKAKREAEQAKRETERAKREAARLRKEGEANKRKAELARKKAAKIEAAQAKKEAAIQKKDAAARRGREKKEAKVAAKAAAKASNKPGKGGEHVTSPLPAYGIDYRPVVVGNKSEPTPHGYYWEFRKHDKHPYVVRDVNHPTLGILVDCPSKVAAEQKIWEYEREAALVAA